MKPHYLLPLILLSQIGCGAEAWDSANGGSVWDDMNGSSDAAASDVSGAEDAPLPEQELDLGLQAPQAGLHYVFVAASERDSVVRIDAESLSIRVIPVGGRPTRVATLPGTDNALVINSGTQDLSIIRSSQSDDIVKTVDILPHSNTIVVAPDGKHALVFYSEKMAESGDPVGDFQTVSLVRLVEGEETMMKVSTGFRPSSVFFEKDDPVAYLVTDDGIGVLDLSKAKNGTITPIVPVSSNPTEDPARREVQIESNGEYAVVRYQDEDSLRVVDLAGNGISIIPLEDGATDVDFIPGSAKALVVMREIEKAAVLDLDKAFGPSPEEAVSVIQLGGARVGASVVSSDGSRAVLYTTVGTEKAVAILDLSVEGFPVTYYPLQKAVVGADLSPDGKTALLLHKSEDVPSGTSGLSGIILKSNGFTLLDMDTGYRKLIQTQQPWSQYLFVGGEELDRRVFVLTPDPQNKEHELVLVGLTDYLQATFPLISMPSSMVYVPLSNKIAVAQEHPSGRISFVDVLEGTVYSVTGYEISGYIH